MPWGRGYPPFTDFPSLPESLFPPPPPNLGSLSPPLLTPRDPQNTDLRQPSRSPGSFSLNLGGFEKLAIRFFPLQSSQICTTHPV